MGAVRPGSRVEAATRVHDTGIDDAVQRDRTLRMRTRADHQHGGCRLHPHERTASPFPIHDPISPFNLIGMLINILKKTYARHTTKAILAISIRRFISHPYRYASILLCH
ncbi:hypothetical protein [Burkholderia cenocepacia]|uniref:hypothetical protein n=1 Tax=Burkholderia cenocepacia TaxID=95486 RepID=UPI00201216C3|nr:hypothetical protein [Burkholderia cenocepacia]